MHTEHEHKPKVGITIGDVNGVTPEVIIKALSDKRVHNMLDVVIYGNSKAINFHKKAIKSDRFEFTNVDSVDKLNPKVANIFNVTEDTINITLGEPSEETGKLALLAMDTCLADLKAGKIDFMVTGPLNKSTIKLENMAFKGQTEYISRYFETKESLMLLVNEDLRVALATNHLSVKEVPEKLTSEIIYNKLEVLDHSLKRDFLIERPRIAVMGLNPHAGDNNLIGKEESDIILPAINKAKDKGILAFGPAPADGYFGTGTWRKFDATLAMYHDQGLIPFKTISFGHGVNYTAGLPVVRTSPDHGTGYDIAGKDMADPSSLLEALFLGMDIISNRADYDEMTANPVVKGKAKKERY